MLVNTDNLVAMTEANQNFSKVVKIVDENGMAVILKNNKPKYVLIDFNSYDDIQNLINRREEKIIKAADSLINENLQAFRELAK